MISQKLTIAFGITGLLILIYFIVIKPLFPRPDQNVGGIPD